jgi:membrane protein YqaA with SNARE-associated domain
VILMPNQIPFLRKFWSAFKRHHESNQSKGIYGYMWWTGLKIIFIWFLIMIPLIFLLRYLIDLNPLFHYIVEHLSDGFVFVVFLLSESFLGMIPPDIFIIWAGKFNSALLFVTILGVLSYIGGIFSYYIGYWLSARPKIKAYSERALNKYIILARKWGGAFIIISALFPFSPFSMVIIAVSLLKYPFNRYLIFGISRIIRFVVQGIFYLKILNVDTFFNIL